MTKKQLRKRIIRYQNNAAKRGGHIPSVAQARLVIEAQEANDDTRKSN